MVKNKNKSGLSLDDLKKKINKKCGYDVAHSLEDDNPTEVKEWISTGSRWLDSIICRGQLAGIPVGKITEIAGLEGSGKSYMAAKIAANAQKMDMDVIYFDSESAISPDFMEKAGCDLKNLLYVQAQSVEFVLEIIEQVLAEGSRKTLFIWDSLALTPAIGDIESSFDPGASMALKARVLSKGLSKIIVPIANMQCTLLVLNQLKENVRPKIKSDLLTEPYTTPGGKSLIYAYSLRLWLTKRKAKAAYVKDDKGFNIGSEHKITIKKSRFGSERRQCGFQILWGEEVRILDEESWLEAVKESDNIRSAGSWKYLMMEDGTEVSFQAGTWLEKLKDPKFHSRVLQLMDEEVILKYQEKTKNGIRDNLPEFNDIDGEGES